MSTPENPEASFIAKITASTTHEIRNVLAIIKESAGLIADVIQTLGAGAGKHQERLLRAVGRIDAQVSRGTEIISNLNRLAHSLDRTQDTVDLNQEVQQVALLYKRFADQRKHLLQVELGDDKLLVVVNSLQLQMALSKALECCVDQLPEASTLTLRTGHHGDRAAVEFIGDVAEGVASPNPSQAPGWDRLTKLLEGLRASLEVSDSEYRFVTVFPLAGVA